MPKEVNADKVVEAAVKEFYRKKDRQNVRMTDLDQAENVALLTASLLPLAQKMQKDYQGKWNRTLPSEIWAALDTPGVGEEFGPITKLDQIMFTNKMVLKGDRPALVLLEDCRLMFTRGTEIVDSHRTRR